MEAEAFKHNTRDFWDANPCGLSSTWEAAVKNRFDYTDPYLLEYLTPDRFAGQRVLEIGCGQGLDASRIIPICEHYVGVDLSSASLAIGDRENRRMHAGADFDFVQGDAENLPFADGRFSLAYSVGVLHHTPCFERAICEAHRVLRRDGRMLLMLYHSFTPLWSVVRVTRGLLRAPGLGPAIRSAALRRMRGAKHRHQGSSVGTAFLELVGCPIISTYTLTGLRRRLRGLFEIRASACYRVGVDQLIRCVPGEIQKHWPQSVMRWIEERSRHWLGFYLVVIAQKQDRRSRSSRSTSCRHRRQPLQPTRRREESG